MLILANTYGNYLFDILVCGRVTTKTTQQLKGERTNLCRLAHSTR